MCTCPPPSPQGCQEAPLAKVLSVEGHRKTKWAPAPLSTLELQKRGTQYLRLPGEVWGFVVAGWGAGQGASLNLQKRGRQYPRLPGKC